MRITEIQIKNYRAITSASLEDLPQSTVIYGLNGHAKSSIITAIQLLFLGFNRHTNRAGQGAVELIKDDADSAEITSTVEINDAVYQVGMTISRGRGKKTEWWCMDAETGEVMEKLDSRDAFWRLAGINPRHALICMMPLEAMNSSELGDVLAEFLGSNLNPEVLKQLAAEHWDWLVKFARDKHANIKTAEDLRHIGKLAYEKRTELNREIKQADARRDDLLNTCTASSTRPLVPVDALGDPQTPENLPTIEARLAHMNHQRDGFIRDIGRAEGAVDVETVAARKSQLEAAKWAVEHEIDAQAEAVNELRARLAANVEAGKQIAREVEDAHTAVNGARRTRDKAKGDAERAQRDLDAAGEALASLRSPEAACPTCARKYTDALVKKLAGPIENQFEAARAALVTAQGAYDAADATVNTAAEALKAVEVRLQDLRAQHGPIRADLDAAREVLTALESQQTQYSAEIAALPTPGPAVDVETLRIGLRACDQTIAEIAGLREAVMQYRDYLEAVKHAEWLRGAVMPLDWAVDAFHHGSLLNELMMAEINTFVSRCNAELAAFQFRLQVQVDGRRVEPVLCVPGRRERPARLCSDGEILIGAFAVAAAFADTGAPVLLDNLNELDHERRKAVLGVLRERATGSVICAGATQQSGLNRERIANALHPAALVWCDDGTIERITPPALQVAV